VGVADEIIDLTGDEPAAVWTVAPRGAVDLQSCEQFARSFREVIDGGGRVVVLDLGEVDFLDSSGIREIVRSARELEDLGGRLLVEHASGAVQRVLEVTGILEGLKLEARHPGS
jgi:anti-sigma B factor antagonist